MPLADVLNETVTRIPQTEDRRHDSTDGTSAPVTARVERRQRLIRTQDGEEVLSTAQIWIDGNQMVAMTDEWDVDGVRHQVIRVEKPSDEDGVHHTKIYLR